MRDEAGGGRRQAGSGRREVGGGRQAAGGGEQCAGWERGTREPCYQEQTGAARHLRQEIMQKLLVCSESKLFPHLFSKTQNIIYGILLQGRGEDGGALTNKNNNEAYRKKTGRIHDTLHDIHMKITKTKENKQAAFLDLHLVNILNVAHERKMGDLPSACHELYISLQ